MLQNLKHRCSGYVGVPYISNVDVQLNWSDWMTEPASTGDGHDGVRRTRADARRNIEAILDATEARLAHDPECTVAEIARAAGVGRVTLYGHFPTRADLVDAVFQRVTARANKTLDAVDTSGEPAAALTELIRASWEVVHAYRAVLAAAERELPAERVRGHHDRHLERLTTLIARGRKQGTFRTDLPQDWLVTTCYTLMHAAAGEVVAGRLDHEAAQAALIATLVSAYTPPTTTGRARPRSAEAKGR
jgi:AcrR family transcriptional regulator